MTAQFRADILDDRIELAAATHAPARLTLPPARLTHPPARLEHHATAERDGHERPMGGVYRNVLKRALDILLVVLSLPVTVPVILLSAIVVALDGGHPFYSQPRLGLNGRVFRMWKLRSMEVGADQALERHLARDPALRAEWDAHQKLSRDPRITAVGEFLRKSSIDELPQIWNILRGDMSIVGPRPMMPHQRPLYPGDAYFRMRPGLTGLWQVTARNNSVFAFRAACDARYERRLSLGLDLRVILSTFRVVLRCTGK
jgi:exopolysaccharide production protein ExoY